MECATCPALIAGLKDDELVPLFNTLARSKEHFYDEESGLSRSEALHWVLEEAKRRRMGWVSDLL